MAAALHISTAETTCEPGVLPALDVYPKSSTVPDIFAVSRRDAALAMRSLCTQVGTNRPPPADLTHQRLQTSLPPVSCSLAFSSTPELYGLEPDTPGLCFVEF